MATYNKMNATNAIPLMSHQDNTESSSKPPWLNIKEEYLKYDNSQDMIALSTFINLGRLIDMSQFVGRQTLYAIVTNIRRTHSCVIIKFGYTTDIVATCASLKNELETDIHLIGIKPIENKKIEHDFHRLMKLRFPDSNDPIEIRRIKKTKLYKFSLGMMREFDSVAEDYSQILQQMNLTSAEEVLMSEKKKINDRLIFMIQNDMRTFIMNTNNQEIIDYYNDAHQKYLQRCAEYQEEERKLEEELRKLKHDNARTELKK